jgi:hypothetical protein
MNTYHQSTNPLVTGCGHSHFLRDFSSLPFLFIVRIDSLRFLLHDLCLLRKLLMELIKSRTTNLLNGEFLVSLDLNFTSLFKCLLLDKGNLEQTNTEYCYGSTYISQTILFISVRTSSSFNGRDDMVW